MYQVKYSDKVFKQLKKLDIKVQKDITTWIAKNLLNIKNPREKGKPLQANRTGQWRYRIGDYRLICEIKDKELVILALSLGHRKSIYDE